MRHIKERGSFYKIGRRVGEACRQDIPEVYDRGVAHLLEHTKAKNINQIHEIAARYMAVAQRTWEPAVEFLRGLAKGSGVTMDVITLTAFTEEVSTEVGLKPADKCSTLVVKTLDGQTIIIHNEDFEPHNFGKMVLLEAEFDGFPAVTCLAYPGQLWGSGLSFNARRIAITKNGLHLPAVPGLPTQLVQSRASLAHKLAEAEEWVMMPPISVPAHYILGWGETGEAISLLVSNLQASYAEVKLHHIKGPFCFTNHVPFGWFNLKEPDPALENSLSTLPRYEKLKSLSPAELPQTPAEAFKLFGEPPLFLKPGKPGASVTMATAVIYVEGGQMWVRDADPNASKKEWYFAH